MRRECVSILHLTQPPLLFPQCRYTRSEDFISAEYREEVLVALVEDEYIDDVESPPLAMQLLPLSVAAALVAAWYSKRKKRIKSGMHKKRDEEC